MLSTQAMLGTLMKMSSISITETNTNNENWFNKGTASATINWILKDGLGQAGGIILISLLGNKLDSHARILRFHATILFVIGSLLEFLIPCINSASEMGSFKFLLMAASGNVLKNVSWMMVSATRAHFMKNFALKDNLGDLTGKAGSQMTLASLIGTGLGLLSLKFQGWIFTTWLVSAIVSIVATHRSCRLALSVQLNPERISKIFEIFSKHQHQLVDYKNISRYIWTPEIVGARENILIWPSLKKNGNLFGSRNELFLNIPLSEVFNESLSTEKLPIEWIIPIDQLEVKQFCLAKSKTKLFLWTLDSATSKDKLIGIITAALNIFNIKDVKTEAFICALKQQGWDVDNFNCKELEELGRCLRLENSNTIVNKNKRD